MSGKKISKVAEKDTSVGGIETSKPDTLSLAKPNLLSFLNPSHLMNDCFIFSHPHPPHKNEEAHACYGLKLCLCLMGVHISHYLHHAH